MAQGKGNPEINKKVATSALVTTLLSGVGFYLGNRYWEAVASFGGQFFEHWGDGFAAMWPLIAENPAHIDMSPNAMLAGLTMCVLVWLFWLRYVAFVGNFRAGEESGSARWGTLKEGKQFRDLTTEDNNLIFTQNFGLALHRPKFNPELDRNLNVLVVGGSGSGKTFNYVTPNICQLNTSYFITDPKGTLLKDAGFLFTDNGYKVKSFNTINLDESMHYKGGVGKTTLADELAFALERRGSTVAFVSTDPQGGSVHEVCDDPDYAESCDYQIVDTAGVLNDGMGDWCRAADVILIPMLPSTRDVEPTMRTYQIAKDSGTDATIRLVVNNFYAFGKLDKQLVEFLESEQVPVIAKVPRAVALSQAAAEGKSVAEHSPHSHVIPALEELADSIINEKEKKYV